MTPRHLTVAAVALLALAWAWLPEFTVTLLNYIALYALVAVGLVLLTGVGGMTSFGQAAFVGTGAYATAWVCVSPLSSAALTGLLPPALWPWLGLLLGLALTAGLAWGLGAITLKLSGHYLPLCTIAWGLSLYFCSATWTPWADTRALVAYPRCCSLGCRWPRRARSGR